MAGTPVPTTVRGLAAGPRHAPSHPTRGRRTLGGRAAPGERTAQLHRAFALKSGLPDFEPVNKRVYWKKIYNDDEDDSTPPEIRERTLTDHVYDSNGNLAIDFGFISLLNTALGVSEPEKAPSRA